MTTSAKGPRSAYHTRGPQTETDTKDVYLQGKNTSSPHDSSTENLTPQDLAGLAKSYITPEIARAAGIYRVDSIDGAEIVGRRPSGGKNYSGLVFPYMWPGEGHPREYRLRRDEPDLEQGPEGKIKEQNKYLSPIGKGNLLYFAPNIKTAWLEEKSVPVTIVEGEKKTLAMHRYYQERGEDRLVIGLAGVYGWKGKTGVTTNGNGSKSPVRGPIPDLNRIVWAGRSVLILFDVNVATNDLVARARLALAKELRKRWADVLLIDLPETPGVNGVDDLLALKGSDHVESILKDVKDFGAASDGFFEDGGAIYWLKNAGTDTVRLTNFAARITGDVVRDDGAEQTRLYEVSARLSEQTESRRGTVTAEEFEAMRWPGRILGARAVVYPNQKERAAVAVRLLSEDLGERRVIAHTGWRNDSGQWLYYHAGGAIGHHGLVEAEVDLPSQFSCLNLPDPPTGDRLREVVRAVAHDLPKVASEVVTLPLIGSAFASVLSDCNFSVFIYGGTGAGKSQLAALVQSFFGHEYHDDKKLPGSWSSSANWLETMAHTAKDTIFVVDDFCPQGSPQDQARLHAAADRLLRAQGNHSGRGRSRTDGSARPVRPPRGVIISTGEDVPRGQSLRARMIILQAEKDTETGTQWEHLTHCQKQAREGVYAEAMSAFIQWLARDGRIETLRGDAALMLGELRDVWLKDSPDSHKRSATMLAHIERAWDIWIQFADDALDSDDVTGLRESIKSALTELGGAQSSYQVSENPAVRFIELIQAAIVSGRAHLAPIDGDRPLEKSNHYGWWEGEPRGDRIGWMDGHGVYLDPDSAYKCAQTMATNGEGLTVGSKTLWKRLKEAGRLATVDKDRILIKKQVGTQRKRVAHLKAETLFPLSLSAEKSGQSGQSGQ